MLQHMQIKHANEFNEHQPAKGPAGLMGTLPTTYTQKHYNY